MQKSLGGVTVMLITLKHEKTDKTVMKDEELWKYL